MIPAIVLALLFLGPLSVPSPAPDLPGSTMEGAPPTRLAVDDGGPGAEAALAAMGGSFLANMGQLDDPDVRYYAMGDPLSVGLTPDGAVFTLREAAEAPRDAVEGPMSMLAPEAPASARATGFAVRFDGCNEVEPRGTGRLGHPTNFLIGNDESRWVRGAGSFEEVVYEDLWDGIDLVYYFKDGMFKYDLVVEAGADPDDVVMRYEGVEGLERNAGTGDLLIRTALGQLRDQRPVLLSSRGGERLQAPAAFRLLDPGSVGFEVPEAEAAGGAFVIDPGLIWATFVGGMGSEVTYAVHLDAEGDLYSVGYTQSTDFPITSGTIGEELKDSDAYVVKVDGEDSTLLVATFVGGSSTEIMYDLFASVGGDVLMVGQTYSPDFPITADAIQSTPVEEAAFLLKLDANLSTVLYGTFLDGSSQEYASVVECLDDGTTYVLGVTSSNDLCNDEWGFRGTRESGRTDNDYFILRLDPSLSRVLNGTYVGGTGDDPLALYPSWGDLHIDRQGNVYCGGMTCSEDFPTTQRYFGGGASDGFIAKFDGELSTLLGSTYLGGVYYDEVTTIDVDTYGYVFVTGTTNSPDFPVRPDAISTRINQGKSAALEYCDGFITIVTDELVGVYSTYLGGQYGDYGVTTVLGPNGTSLYVSTLTTSNDLTTTPGAFDPYLRTECDIFLWKMDLFTGEITYSTYIGGTNSLNLCPRQIEVDEEGMVYLGIFSGSKTLITTEGAWDRNYSGEFDLYLLKLDPTPCAPPGPPINFTVDAVSETHWPISWTDPEFNGGRILEVRIYRYDDTSIPGAWVLETSLPWSESAHEYDDLWIAINSTEDHGVLDRFRISLVNSAGEGEPSNIAECIWVIPPSAPVGLNASTDGINGTVILTWSPPERTGTITPLDYTIYRGMSEDYLTALVDVGNNTSFVDSGVVTGQAHYYAIGATNERGEGPWSNLVCIVPVRPPSSPRDFRAVPGDELVELSWLAPSDDGGSPLKGYRLYRGGSPEDLILLVELPASACSFVDTGLINGMLYHYNLLAYTAVAPGPWSGKQNATPFTVPSAPKALRAEASDGQAILTWNLPNNDGGFPIEGYRVFFGQSISHQPHALDVGDVYTYAHTGLTNGETYCYRVVALTKAGAGESSDVVSVVPMGLPDAPGDLEIVQGEDGVAIIWTAPRDWGGATSLTYHVLRGTSEGALQPLVVVWDALDCIDRDVLGGLVYFYAVQAESSVGVGAQSDTVNVTIREPPGPAEEVLATAGNGWIRLTWSPPLYDGRAEVTEYILLKGPVGRPLSEVGSMHMALGYNDTNVVNGVTYQYVVLAVNIMGRGDASPPVDATPYALPSSPFPFNVRAREDGIELTWGLSAPAGDAPVTGYLVLRGSSADSIVRLVEVGSVLSYFDIEVEEGRTYYYQVVALSDMGPGAPTPIEHASSGPAGYTGTGPTTVGAILLVLLVVGLVLVYAMAGRRRRAGLEEGSEAAGDRPTGDATTPSVTGPTTEAVVASAYLVEEVFVVRKDGRLVTSCAKETGKSQEGEMMSGMLIAVQGIIQDGLQLGGTLVGIKYGDNNILMATGEHVILAAVVYGQPDDALREKLGTTVQVVEATYAGVIEEWVGDAAIAAGVEGLIMPILDLTGALTREDVEGVTAPHMVSLLSAVDFFRGYVRLKVAAVNSTNETMGDAAIELRYDMDMLRLAWAEPRTLRLKGDRVMLGNVKPGERKTVAFLFDPQICHQTDIFGTLTYYDSRGQLCREQMKRRRAEIVCPVFASVANANTAMLRRLIKDSLHHSDHRVLIYPDTMSPGEVRRLGKAALDMNDLQLVREFVADGPPVEVEAWYYGMTRVKGYQMVIRLGVIEQRRALELFVASSSMEPVAGLIAEFRRALERSYREQHPKGAGLMPSDDEEARRDLAARDLLIDRVDLGEGPYDEG